MTDKTSESNAGQQAVEIGCNDKLGPPPNAGTLICWRAGEQVCTMEQAREYAAREVAAERQRWRLAVDKLGNARAFLAGWQGSESCKRNGMENEVGRWIEGIGDLFSLYRGA